MSNREAKEEVILEHTSLAELRAHKANTQALLDYHWKFYSELAGQRKKVQEELFSALTENTVGPIDLPRWQRAMKLRYAPHPLCVVGSLNSQTGGRFNIGSLLNKILFPPFPALYAAIDRETAEFELLCQDKTEAGLTNYDFALAKKESIAVVSVSIRLEKCFDLRKAKYLSKFARKIRNFTLSAELKRMASSLGIQQPSVVKTASQLRSTLLTPDWKSTPMGFDVPANPQIFGQLLHEAGIEGCIYPSRMTGRDAVAVFTRNLKNGHSWIELDEEPLASGIPKRLSASNFELAEQTAKQLGAILK